MATVCWSIDGHRSGLITADVFLSLSAPDFSGRSSFGRHQCCQMTKWTGTVAASGPKAAGHSYRSGQKPPVQLVSPSTDSGHRRTASLTYYHTIVRVNGVLCCLTRNACIALVWIVPSLECCLLCSLDATSGPNVIEAGRLAVTST